MDTEHVGLWQVRRGRADPLRQLLERYLPEPVEREGVAFVISYEAIPMLPAAIDSRGRVCRRRQW